MALFSYIAISAHITDYWSFVHGVPVEETPDFVTDIRIHRRATQRLLDRDRREDTLRILQRQSEIGMNNVALDLSGVRNIPGPNMPQSLFNIALDSITSARLAGHHMFQFDCSQPLSDAFLADDAYCPGLEKAREQRAKPWVKVESLLLGKEFSTPDGNVRFSTGLAEEKFLSSKYGEIGLESKDLEANWYLSYDHSHQAYKIVSAFNSDFVLSVDNNGIPAFLRDENKVSQLWALDWAEPSEKD